MNMEPDLFEIADRYEQHHGPLSDSAWSAFQSAIGGALVDVLRSELDEEGDLQVAIPRPSKVAPMWAHDPTRTRRTRNR